MGFIAPDLPDVDYEQWRKLPRGERLRALGAAPGSSTGSARPSRLPPLHRQDGAATSSARPT